jgi:uncharacterized lipoprotein NlpE involved in copper resistance
MKRVMSILLVIAFAFTLVGCACTQEAKKCSELCQSALVKAQQVEQSCANYAKQAETAAMKAEAAAQRATAAADKCENVFMKKLKK